ncbi:unnamed protein product [Lota lota]
MLGARASPIISQKQMLSPALNKRTTDCDGYRFNSSSSSSSTTSSTTCSTNLHHQHNSASGRRIARIWLSL